MQLIRRLIDVPAAAPDTMRRSRLLNILLMSVSGLAILTILTATLSIVAGIEDLEQNILLYSGSLVLLLGLIVIWLINRSGRGRLASVLFLALLTIILTFADQPEEVVNGRSLFLFAIPILMASVLLPPYSSFVIATLISLLLAGVALNAHIVPNPYAMFAFYVFSLVAWLSARSLENALAELRLINLELDQRVEERTHELAVALDRVQAEASKNQAILEGIADGVIVFDQDGKAIVANPAIGRLIGQPFNQIIDLDISSLMNQDVDPADQEMVISFLKSKELRHSSAKFEWGPKTLSVSFAPVLDTGGQATGTVAVFRDFTREAEIDRMKSTFVSIASHELRTPLNAIMGYVEMLEEGVYGPLSPKQHGPIGRVMANTGQLLNLANNLLDQAQIEAGKLTLQTTQFSPSDLIEGVKWVMEVLAQNKGLDLSFNISEKMPPKLLGDQQRLHQILVNLVNNAIKFTPEGEVRVDVYLASPERWAFSVTDTGPGIPTKAQNYIFDSFRQVDDTTTREHRGAGLGLSIVKQLVSLMGGEITLDSQLGHGSTFTVTLPLNLP